MITVGLLPVGGNKERGKRGPTISRGTRLKEETVIVTSIIEAGEEVAVASYFKYYRWSIHIHSARGTNILVE